MLSREETATIRDEIERLEKARKDCTDSGLRKWIEAANREPGREGGIRQRSKVPPYPISRNGRQSETRYARAPTEMMHGGYINPLWRRRKLTSSPLVTFWIIPVACPSTKGKALLRKQNLPPRGK